MGEGWLGSTVSLAFVGLFGLGDGLLRLSVEGGCERHLRLLHIEAQSRPTSTHFAKQRNNTSAMS